MQLIALQTTNFKKLGSRLINFTNGVNFICGDNGQGKSTVLRAVAACLFGSRMVPGLSDDIPTRGTSTWLTELTFTHDGVEYLVTRGSNKASIHIGYDLVANGNTAVTQYICDLLNIQPEDYNLLMHSRQGETNYILTYGATALQRKVEEFSGIAVIDKIIVEASRRGREATQLATNLEAKCLSADQVQELKNTRVTAEDTLALREFELRELMKQELPVKPVAPTQDLSALRSQYRAYAKYLYDAQNYTDTKNRLTVELSELPQTPELLDERELNKRLIEAKGHRKTAQQSLAEYNEHKAKLAAAEQALAEVVGNDTESTDLAGELGDLISHHNGVLASLSGKISEESTALNLIHSNEQQRQGEIKKWQAELDSGVCGSCGTKLHAADSMEKLTAQIEAHKTSIIQQRMVATLHEEKLGQLREDSKKVQENIQSLTVRQRAFTKATGALAELQSVEQSSVNWEAEVQHCTTEIANLTVELEQIEQRNSETNALAKKKLRLEVALQELEKPATVEEVTSEQVTCLEEEYSQYEKESADYKNSELRHKLEVETLTNKVNLAEQEMNRSSQQLDSNKQLIVEIEALAAQLDKATRLSNYLKERRAVYLSEVWASITTVASTFLNSVTKGRLAKVTIQDGKFIFMEDGSWMPAVEASGAQAAFLGVSLRVGLNKALYRGNTFMAFDEPTEAMTEENARNLVAGISGEAKQVFIITHKQTDQVMSDTLIEV